jgi:hypothetical protein
MRLRKCDKQFLSTFSSSLAAKQAHFHMTVYRLIHCNLKLQWIIVTCKIVAIHNISLTIVLSKDDDKEHSVYSGQMKQKNVSSRQIKQRATTKLFIGRSTTL